MAPRMVVVTMNGNKTITGVKIDPEVVDKEDVEMLQDLVIAAVNEACRKVDEAAQRVCHNVGCGHSLCEHHQLKVVPLVVWGEEHRSVPRGGVGRQQGEARRPPVTG